MRRSPRKRPTALQAAGSHLRGVVGRQMRIRQVPRLEFAVDPGIVSGQRIEDILREIHHREASTDESGGVVDPTGRTRERRSSGRGGADAAARRDRVGRAGVPRVSRQSRRRRARFDARRCTTCCAPRASTASRRSPSRSSSPRTTASFRGSSCSRSPDRFPAEPEVMVTFDSGSLARLGDLERPAKAAEELVVIDHHVSNQRYGTINVIDPDAAASGVLVRRLIDRLGLPMTRDAAVCLYAALVCDTGRFQYQSTTPAVFELARELVLLRPPDPGALAHALRGAPLRVPPAPRRRAATRGARRRQGVRLDEGDAGRPRPATASPSRRSRASSTCCAALARRRSRAC